MPPKDKSKAAGVNASSFFDLKAELSKQEEDFAKRKRAGESTSIVGGIKRPDKKPTVWVRQNKGVKSRAARDIVELEAISKPTLDSARAALERKAKIYDKLRKGKSGGLNDKQYDSLLVDFDSKGPSEYFQSESEDEDESLAVPRAPHEEEDDPVIEYEDEFGRIRTARRSDVPREFLPRKNAVGEDDIHEDDVIYNPVNHFPVYEHSAEKQAEIIEAYSEANNPLSSHYDASNEVRAKGAGFYQFSKDEETRRAQMEELKAVREETSRTRKETGAVDIKPGEVEGIQDGAEGATGGEVGMSAKSRAMEKRKRDIEERRKLIDAKRRKVKGGGDSEAASASLIPDPLLPVAGSSASLPSKQFPDPFAVLESSATVTATTWSTTAAATSNDPFAALEAQAKSSKGKPPSTDADTFLEQLERDFKSSKRR